MHDYRQRLDGRVNVALLLYISLMYIYIVSRVQWYLEVNSSDNAMVENLIYMRDFVILTMANLFNWPPGSATPRDFSRCPRHHAAGPPQRSECVHIDMLVVKT